MSTFHVAVCENQPLASIERFRPLPLSTRQLSVRALIEAHVGRLLDDYRDSRSGARDSWLLALGAERGAIRSATIEIDADLHCRRACEAFARQRYFLFVDDRQCASLDERVTLNELSVVRFFRLLPLVGG